MVAGKKGSFCGPGTNLTIYNSYLAKNLVFSEGPMKALEIAACGHCYFRFPELGNKFPPNLSKSLSHWVFSAAKKTVRVVIFSGLSFLRPCFFYLSERPFFLQKPKKGIMLDSSYRFGYSR